jgi:hypothetical protein
MVTGSGLAALLSVSAANVVKVSKMLDKQMDSARVKDDPEAVMRMFSLVTDYNISLIESVAKVMVASKSKDGKLPGLNEQVLGAIDATMGASVGDPAAKKNSRITRLVG